VRRVEAGSNRVLLPRGLSYIVLVGLFGACSGAADNHGTVDGTVDSALDGAVDGADVVSMTGTTCQTIRICVAMCADTDRECGLACAAKGSPQAQEMFQAVANCTSQYCPAADFNCGCEQQCFPAGNCLAETDACAAGVSDDQACMFCR
jgi:hypothetical protein